MTKRIDRDETPRRLANAEPDHVAEEMSEPLVMPSDSGEHNRNELPRRWFTIEEYLATLPPETQAEIEAGAKQMIQKDLDARRAKGIIRYLTATEGHAHIARCLDVDVASEGSTKEEAVDNLRAALHLYFDGHPEMKVTFEDNPDWTEEWIKTRKDVDGGRITMERLIK